MLILYITYISFGQAVSGSGVRPQKMYRAFLDEGHEVLLLAGSQNKAERAERRERVEKVSAWLDTHTPDICYIESPVYPILWPEDYRLIRKVREKGVPIGYFYRDFYWKFPEFYPRRTDLSGRLKDAYLDMMQRRTDKLLELADIVYFPSTAASEYFRYRDMRALPPAGEAGKLTGPGEENTCIYVGGIEGDYGGRQLLEAFRLLNEGDETFRLILACREKEVGLIPEALRSAPWLEIHHTSGAGLDPLYARASLAMIPVQRNAYTDVSVNIKFFEYLSYGMPVASTDVTAIAALVRENGVGQVSGDSPAEIADNVRDMLSDPQRLENWRRQAAAALEQGNLWIHRARRVAEDLLEKKQ